MLTKEQIVKLEEAGGVFTSPASSIEQIRNLQIPEDLKQAMITLKTAQRQINDILESYKRP